MTVVWLLDGCALRLCHRPGRASVALSSSPLRNPFRTRERLSCRPGRGRRFWFCRVGPYANISAFSTSARQGAADLRYRTSRLRGALESAWKAVSGTRAEILSRLKAKETPPLLSEAPPSTLPATPANIPEQEENGVTGATPPTAPRAAPTTHQAPPTVPQAPPTTYQVPPTVPQAPPTAYQDPPSSLVAAKIQKQKERDVARTAPPTTPQATPTDQTTPLFHPGSLSAHLGETYDYLSHHINSYFSSFTKPDQSAAPPASSRPETSSFSLGNYLNYSKPSVQAFVGNYISPLVPRFRTEPRRVSTEADKPAADGERSEAPESKDPSAAEERARRLQLQREKIVARVSVDNRTRALVQALQRASDVRLCVRRVEELSLHLLEFPETRSVAVKEQVIPRLLRLRQAADESLRAAVRQALALVGFIDPVKNRGVRILSIDGGGTRGLLALQTLRRLQELSGKPVHLMFDYICGVSTGAILGFMLGVLHMPLKECEDLYRTLSSDVFKQNVIVGTVKMSWSHAFYDSQIWEKVLKEKMGSDLLIQTARIPDCPKVAAVSTVVNRGPPVKAFVFRNYTLPVGVRSHYRGGCRHKLWEAIRASSAAPGYFQEFALGDDLHQDGGMLVNNPTALAIHECQCLWPDVPLQCVVSLGTGRFESAGSNSVSFTSLKTKLTNVISSATDTEEVHTMLDALLPPNTYFRFNPLMSEEVALDERRGEKLSQLQAEALRYLERNQDKLRRAVGELNRDKRSVQSLTERLRLRALMYGL
ncbi:calcium-independent phospholipase A2-gamma isoform X2 [Chanodichthys erythropterus]|uniref:calcium-independent phospholipase A2-gamma isoform X2 n=1 Tax=Chanodichthys erythropterus TaxID=933992 RepID=UPI00351EE1FE